MYERTPGNTKTVNQLVGEVLEWGGTTKEELMARLEQAEIR